MSAALNNVSCLPADSTGLDGCFGSGILGREQGAPMARPEQCCTAQVQRRINLQKHQAWAA
jgi:hypothetical protein